jgi:hypothetical protein
MGRNKQRFTIGFVLFATAVLIVLFGDKTFPTAGAVALAVVGLALMAAGGTAASGHGA